MLAAIFSISDYSTGCCYHDEHRNFMFLQHMHHLCLDTHLSTSTGGVSAHSQVQMACDHTETPIWFQGLNIGTMADCNLWKQHVPPLEPWELWLADLAYISCPHLVTPFKRPRGGQLTDEEKNYNEQHSWYVLYQVHVIPTHSLWLFVHLRRLAHTAHKST
jgi:hypothetical protein